MWRDRVDEDEDFSFDFSPLPPFPLPPPPPDVDPLTPLDELLLVLLVLLATPDIDEDAPPPRFGDVFRCALGSGDTFNDVVDDDDPGPVLAAVFVIGVPNRLANSLFTG